MTLKSLNESLKALKGHCSLCNYQFRGFRARRVCAFCVKKRSFLPVPYVPAEFFLAAGCVVPLKLFVLYLLAGTPEFEECPAKKTKTHDVERH